MKRTLVVLTGIFLIILIGGYSIAHIHESRVEQMVRDHAEAWKTGDEELLASVLHEDVIFAYPGRRLDYDQTMEDLRYFRDHFSDTQVYIHEIIIDGDDVAVEWQFATTKDETGDRQVVSDAIIARIEDGRFIEWREYLDGRVKLLQATGELHLEEWEAPYPWPLKTELYGQVEQDS